MHKYKKNRDLITEDTVLYDLKIDKNIIHFIPKNILTDSFYLKIIKLNLIALVDVPNKFLTKENHSKIDRLKRTEIDYIPKEDLNDDMCIKYFYLDHKTINKIPKEFLSSIFYYEIVYQDAENMRFVPKECQNLKMMKTFFLFYDAPLLCSDFEEIYLNENLVRKIPYRIYTSSVLRNGLMIRCIPVDCRTKNLCIESVKNTKFKITSLSYSPKKIITFKFLKTIFEDKTTYKELNKGKYKKNLSYNYF
jgi:hypothetical protein